MTMLWVGTLASTSDQIDKTWSILSVESALSNVSPSLCSTNLMATLTFLVVVRDGATDMRLFTSPVI